MARHAAPRWCLGVLAYVGLIVAIFPSIEGSPELDEVACVRATRTF